MSRRCRVAVILLFAFVFAVVAEPRVVTVRYAGLLDRGRMIRTGQTVGEVLRPNLPPSLKAALQPVLDPFTVLLPEAIEMENGPAMTPFRMIEELYPEGGLEPAWVGICRGGRIVMQTDGLGRVRLFLPGENAAAAYAAHYPVIRHALAAVAAAEEGPISVEAYAYRHDYGRSEFRLSKNPHHIRQRSFPPPVDRRALDLGRLEAFFSRGKAVIGAEVDSQAGLVLLGGDGEIPSLDGRPVTLADLAVAYRAIFHAGENAAFISLDPDPDPTLAAVNFGGYLENTAIGRVVLAADKRFKTITTGLDPDSLRDLRPEMERAISGFVPAADQDLNESRHRGRWIGTRFWFYPETVEIESEADFSAVSIGRACFRADAERQREDFANPAEFERFKALHLSPSVRRSIDALNRDYDRYAALFPELRELSTVARLLGLCVWLRKRPARDLDLDALLAVSLPPVTTPRVRTQMLAASWKVSIEGYDAGRERPTVLCFSPELDRPISEFFTSDEELARLLTMMRIEAGLGATGREAMMAASIRASRRHAPVRTLFVSRTDVQAFARYMTERESPQNSFVRRIDAEYEDLIARIRAIDEGVSVAPEERRRREEYVRRVQAIEALAGRPIGTMSVISIGGGINLGPDDFRIRVKPRRAASGVSGRDGVVAGGRAVPPASGRGAAGGAAVPVAPAPRPPAVTSREIEPMRSPAATPAPPPARPRWTDRREGGSSGAEVRLIEGSRVVTRAGAPQTVEWENYWFRRRAEDGSWSERRISGGEAVERTWRPASNRLSVVRSRGGRVESIAARRERDGAIVFERALSAPPPSTGRPGWWEDDATAR